VKHLESATQRPHRFADKKELLDLNIKSIEMESIPFLLGFIMFCPTYNKIFALVNIIVAVITGGMTYCGCRSGAVV
jgi:protein involved in ribonucleotide reduction